MALSRKFNGTEWVEVPAFYSRLTEIRVWGKNQRGTTLSEFQCSCGNKIVVPRTRVTTGETRSCGCLQREHQQSLGKGNKGKKYKSHRVVTE